jgi:ppGpp synthetase/RelA/SpoT-type nucleotidyltranferase
VTSESRADTDHASAEDAEGHIEDEAEDVRQRAHEARVEYEAVRGLYLDYARSFESVMRDCLDAQGIISHSITSRAKDPDSFERKAAQLTPEGIAKYSNPIGQISDKAAIRIITYFLDSVEEVEKVIATQFEVLERERKVSDDPTRFGYQSTHYLVRYLPPRNGLPEYARFRQLVAEIQVRTILQHAWAEIEHDIQYKSSSILPKATQRRFGALAGLIEIADREFQAIDSENREIKQKARRQIDLGGNLENVEITADSIRAFLDKNYGADGRMSEFSYTWTARLLVRLGFTNLAEVEACIRNYDHDVISRTAFGSRRGQLTRFEAVLLASMGDAFILGHPWTWDESYGEGWYAAQLLEQLSRLRAAGVPIGNFKPSQYPEKFLSRSAEFENLRERLSAGMESGSPGGSSDQ